MLIGDNLINALLLLIGVLGVLQAGSVLLLGLDDAGGPAQPPMPPAAAPKPQAEAPITIALRAECGLLEAQVRTLRQFFDAADPLDQLIACRAHEALCEIQRNADQARRELGILPGSSGITMRSRVDK